MNIPLFSVEMFNNNQNGSENFPNNEDPDENCDGDTLPNLWLLSLIIYCLIGE